AVPVLALPQSLIAAAPSIATMFGHDPTILHPEHGPVEIVTLRRSLDRLAYWRLPTMRFVMLSLGLMALFVPFALAALKDTHPFDVRDLVAFDRISEPKLSPDGRQVVFT